MFRQPMSGRSKGGGHRFGEMEGHVISAHGMSEFTNERYCKYSDPFEVDICQNCHNFSSSKTFCKACKMDKIDNVSTSYVTKLLIQELNGLCFKTDIYTEK